MNKEKISPKLIAAIFATGILSFSGVIIETSMNIAFPTLMREFNISTSTVQWLTSIYLLTISIVVPLSANLKSSFKTKNLFVTANLLYLVGLLIGACAPKFGFLLLGRVVEGLGTGISLPLMFNIIMEQVPKAYVGTMMGVGSMITGIAPAIGPTYGGLIVTNLGWRWIFYFMIPLIFVSLLLGIWGIQQKTPVKKVQIDILSLIEIAIFFISMIFGFSQLSTSNFLSLNCGGVILVGIIDLWLLIRRSSQIDDPILDFKLFKDHHFSAHVASFFMIQLISLGNAFLIPNYIQLVNGNTALVAGLVILPAGFAGAIMSPIGGNLLDRFGARKPILTGVSFMIIALLIFSLATAHLSNSLILFVYIAYMGGMGMTLGNVMTDTLDNLDKTYVTQGNAILNTSQQFAGAMGTSISSSFVAFSQKSLNSRGSLATTIGTRHAYIFLLGLACIIFILLARFVKRQINN